MDKLGQVENVTCRSIRKGSAYQNQGNNTAEWQENSSYQSLMNHHPDTFFSMDLFGNIISCNNNVEGILGYTSTEIFGPFHKVIKEEDLPEVNCFFEQAVAGQVQNYDCVAVHKNGQFVDLHVTNIPMFANGEIVGVYGIAKDITELKLTETRLKETETQFQQIYNSLEIGVWSWDIRSHKVIYVSPSIETLTGMKPYEFIEGTRKWKEMIHPDDLEDFEGNQRELRKGIYCQYKYRINNINGEVKWVEARTFPVMDSDGNLVRLDGLITDINKKQLEEEKLDKLFVLERDLKKAIQEEHFFLHYQPKIDTKTKEIVGAEALIRWNHPELGILPPNEFIPLAEESNLIIDLGDWVIEAVCKQIKLWKEEGKRIVPVSVNISAKRFLKDNLVAIMGTIMKETDVEPKWLEIEITETSLLQNEERVLADINSLKAMGITISLDDFGTGYSSISYLKKYKVDFIKIDRSYINGIHTHPDDEAIIKSILYLASELNMKVVAEGVETEQQLEFLKNHKCDLIQGYLFSRPVDVGEFSRLVAKGC
jgi:PAS domain S-box-containing protein